MTEKKRMHPYDGYNSRIEKYRIQEHLYIIYMYMYNVCLYMHMLNL